MSELTGSIKIRTEKVVSEAIELADVAGKFSSSRSIAERVFDSEPELMKELQRGWMVDRLYAMICKARHFQRYTKDTGRQLALPGFASLPSRIMLPDGQRKRLDLARFVDVRAHIAMLRGRLKPSFRIELMEKVLELMQKYSSVQAGITWGEVKQREFKAQEER